MSAEQEKLFAYLIRLADSALILAQQLGDWVGKAPELEEDVALANFALDYVGQARMIYSLAAEVEGAGRTEDDLAFLRDGIDFHNFLLVEQPNGDFATTIARQFYFESFYKLQLEALEKSSNSRLAEIAVKANKEIQYHLRHTRLWLMRLGDGTEESHRRMQSAIDDLWRYTGEMFTADEIDVWAADSAIGPNPADLRQDWNQFLSAALTEATLTRPDAEWMASGGKQGRHSEHLGYLLTDMQFLQRAYPGASW